jgi:hypothetical protein
MGLSDNENYSNYSNFFQKKTPHFFQKTTQFLSRKNTEMPQGQEVPQGQVSDIYRNL